MAALAGAMDRLGEDAALRRAMGTEALATAHQWAGFDTNMEHVAAVFDRLVGGRGEGPATVSLPAIMGRTP